MKKGLNWLIVLAGIGIMSFALISSNSISLSPRNVTKTNFSNELDPLELNATQIDLGCILVRTPQDLDKVRDDLAGHYCQVNDIDLSGYDNWEPIGDFYQGFSGTYDGNHKEIRNLKILQDPSTSEHIGLFARLTGQSSLNPVVIREVILRNISIQGGYQVGGLAGGAINTIIYDTKVIDGVVRAEGIAGGLFGQGGNWIINKSSVEGLTITNSSIVSSYGLGGLIGAANSHTEAGTLFNYNIITHSYVNNTLILGAFQTGGLAGAFRGTIEDSYANTHIEVISDETGGLIGLLDNSLPTIISNSYSLGIINDLWDSGIQGTGGLIGEIIFQTDSPTNNISLINTYSSVAMTSPSYFGGLIGKKTAVVIAGRFKVKNSYWDINVSNTNQSIGGVGKTTAQMKTQSTYQGWDFTNVWKISQNEYPKLKWQN